MSETPGFHWTNWNRNLSCVADRYQPGSLDELCENVRAAAKNGRVRPIGNSCSWSPLIPNSGSLIDLSRLTRVLAMNDTGNPPSVRVEGGVSMRELVRFTETHGLSIISPTIFQGVAMAGAIAVAAHGTGLGKSTLSDEVIDVTLVDAQGEVHQIEQHHGEILDAARCSLGALGVVYAATMKLSPAFNVHVEDRFIPRAEVMAGLKDMLSSYGYVELYWFPFSDTMWCKLMNPTSEPDDKQTCDGMTDDAIDYVATMFSGQVILPFTARYLSWLTPMFSKIAPFFAVRPGDRVLPSSTEFHYQAAYPKNWDMSWGVSLDDAVAAWEMSMELVESYGRRQQYPINMVVHSRFIGPSRALLSPASDRAICDIEAVTCTGTPNIEPFYLEYTDKMLEFASARPHWGKYILRPEQIKARYPKMDAFLAHREKLDPNRVFLNDFLEASVFQLVSRFWEWVLVVLCAAFAVTSFVIDPLSAFGVPLTADSSSAIVRAMFKFAAETDPLLLEDPPMLRAQTAISAFVYGPFYLLLIYALVRRCAWIRVPALVFAGALAINVIVYVTADFVGYHIGRPVFFIAVNVPYLGLAVGLVLRFRK